MSYRTPPIRIQSPLPEGVQVLRTHYTIDAEPDPGDVDPDDAAAPGESDAEPEPIHSVHVQLRNTSQEPLHGLELVLQALDANGQCVCSDLLPRQSPLRYGETWDQELFIDDPEGVTQVELTVRQSADHPVSVAQDWKRVVVFFTVALLILGTLLFGHLAQN